MPTLTQSIGQTQSVAKGLFLDYPPDLVPEGGLMDGRNIQADEGAIERVPGFAKYSATAVPGVGPVMLLLDFVKAAGTRQLLACTTTRLSKYNVATNVFDDVTAGLNLLTGGAGHPIFAGVLNDLFVLTNGKDTLKKYDGTTWAALGGSPPAKAVGLDIYEGHVLLWNVEAIGYRTQWSNLNNGESWAIGAGSDAGILDIREGNLLPILAGGKMRRQFLLYKEQLGGVYAMTYVGGDLVMQVELVVPEFGVFSPRGVAVWGDAHFVMGANEQLWVIAPGAAPVPIGDPVKSRLFKNLNWNAARAAWVGVDPVNRQIVFAIPEGASAVCTRAYLFHYQTGAWGEREFPVSSAAYIRDPEITAINDLTGTIDALVGTIDSLSQVGRDVVFLGGNGSSAYAYVLGGDLQDGAAIDGWAVARWVGRGGKRVLRVRGVEVDATGGITIDLGAASAISGAMSFASLGSPDGTGRVDCNASAHYVAPRFRSVPGSAFRLTGHRLDAYSRGHR